eukprot:COSAG06_NODE_5996_length_3163_cov_1.489883_2_plen_142_part_00
MSPRSFTTLPRTCSFARPKQEAREAEEKLRIEANEARSAKEKAQKQQQIAHAAEGKVTFRQRALHKARKELEYAQAGLREIEKDVIYEPKDKGKVRKMPSVGLFILNGSFLPRQARDKQREIENDKAFFAGASDGHYRATR